ncbi:MAG: histone deacetylase [Nitrospinota bacterium]
MAFVYSPGYYSSMGEHVFPVEKYRLLHEKLIQEGILRPEDFLEPMPAPREDLLLVHTEGYLRRLEKLAEARGFLTMDTPVSPEILRHALLAAGGTELAARKALELGLAANLNGGFHHASAGDGEGFCYINDIAVAARRVQADGRAQRVAIVDCDVHQGNGTALIFGGDPSVFTFSIHQENNYPGIKPPSTLDIGLPDRVGDGEYLRLLEGALLRILDGFGPELVIYLAGADPLERDMLGGLSLTHEGLRARDELVIGEARKRKIPLAAVLAGGYAYPASLTVLAHFNTILTIKEHLQREEIR